MTTFKHTINVKSTDLEIKKTLITKAQEIGWEQYGMLCLDSAHYIQFDSKGILGKRKFQTRLQKTTKENEYFLDLDTNPELFDAVIGIISIREDEEFYKGEILYYTNDNRGNNVQSGSLALAKNNTNFEATWTKQKLIRIDWVCPIDKDGNTVFQQNGEYYCRDFRKAAPQEIIAHFSKETIKKKEMEEFTFDENNWCYNNLLESNSEFIKLFNKKFNINDDGRWFKFYGIKNGNTAHENTAWGTELTFEQFQKHVLKTNNMDKKIIGYKLVKKEYAKAACVIINHQSFGMIIENGEPIYLNDWNREGKERDFKKLKDAGVLNLWFEPVYEPEKPKEIIVKVSGNDVIVKKNQIVAENTNLNLAQLRLLVNRFNVDLGHLNEWKIEQVNPTVSIGCWKTCKLSELQEVIKAYHSLNS